ncbi:glycoside hydrolase family 43 protein [Mucilaginibacter terrae]|uniref:Beta-xylosidase n=1 Tax=Mucilaginibacter terrae TaxID=1955052 RepID=A0ABU3GNQ8_9SPHI|nr:glycoside hydrolase 43 family protein [Mucilaginibacter terrae]MDT3401156.1 beta-xylosidase [Mucilaginibacter terrae]
MKSTLYLLLQIFVLVIFRSDVFCQEAHKWGGQKDGTFSNPVLPADYSDLDAIRVGDDFYAISSTMQFSPGMVILHSKDLVNWEIAGHVVNDLTKVSPNLDWSSMNSYGRGIWAGSIRYYKNKFWVYFASPDDGFFMSSATDPKGPWEPLHKVWDVSGWDDCCSFCDDDGQLYFIATNFKLDPNNNKKYNIHLFKMSQDGKTLLPNTDSIIHQSPGSEANKLYKINGLYYHFFSEVKAEGRVMMMERSQNIHGPWEIRQLNHVNKTVDREPNQGGLIQLKDGKWWFFTHHGSGDWEGRAASLLPVTWIDGWPMIGEVGKDGIGNMVWSAKAPIAVNKALKIQTDDDFSAVTLRPQWEWNYQPRSDKWSLSARKGFLRLMAFRPLKPDDTVRILLRAGNTITQRSMRTKFNIATVKIDISGMYNGQFAGLTHFSTKSYCMIGIKQDGEDRKLVYSSDSQNLIGVTITGSNVWLRSSWDYQGLNRYFYSLNGKDFLPFGNSTQLTWGSYRGDRVGIFNFNRFATKGYIDLDYFDYQYSKQ